MAKQSLLTIQPGESVGHAEQQCLDSTECRHVVAAHSLRNASGTLRIGWPGLDIALDCDECPKHGTTLVLVEL